MKFLELKIPPLLLVLLFGAAMWVGANVAPALTLAGTVTWLTPTIIAGIGGVFAILGVKDFRSAKTTVNPTTPSEASTLVTTGVYKVTRNPMYVGLFFLLFAWGIVLNNWLSLGFAPLFVLYMNRFQISVEEKALLTLFGSDYETFTQNVKRWL